MVRSRLLPVSIAAIAGSTAFVSLGPRLNPLGAQRPAKATRQAIHDFAQDVSTNRAEDPQDGEFGRWLAAGLASGVMLANGAAAGAAPPPGGNEVMFNYRTNPFAAAWDKAINDPNLVPCKDNKKFHKKYKNIRFKFEKFQKEQPQGTKQRYIIDLGLERLRKAEEALG